jgi:hypothetical protein
MESAMKLALTLALALCLALAIGATRWLRPAESEPMAALPATGAPNPEGRAQESTRSELELLVARVAMLEDRLGDLEGELELLRSSVERRPAETAAELAAGAPAERGEFTEAERQAMAAILARAREEEALRRAEERAVREEELLLERARHVAVELALPPADEARLALHLREEARRREAILERWRAEELDRELLAAELLALRDWSEQHLAATFGADLAARIRQAERPRRGHVPGEVEASTGVSHDD